MGCELVIAHGWPSKGCYLHTSPTTSIANGAPLRFCQLLGELDLPFATRRRMTLLPKSAGKGNNLPGNAQVEHESISSRASRKSFSVASWEGERERVPVSATRQSTGSSRTDAPVCKLPATPVPSTIVMVLRDGQGHPLMNNYAYHVRVRAYNGFQPSIPSHNISIHPIGEVPKNVLTLTAECWNSSKAHRCTSGYTGDTRVSISWHPPFYDDGVTDVLGYKIEYSADHGTTWKQHSAQSEKDPASTSYAMTCLLNDKEYRVRVAAINLYGLGSWVQIGPLTPRWCPHLHFCDKCVEPFFEVWGGCKAPKCISLPPPPPPLGAGVVVLDETR
jgi:hypothetical protein